MASAKKPTDGKKKNPCPDPPKGKPPRRASEITQDEIGADMKREGAPSMGKAKELVKEELAQRDVCYEDGEEQLQCKLTQLEIEKLDKQAVRLIGEIETKKAQIASTQSMLNGELKALQQQMSNVAKKAREGTEVRNVQTRTFMDYARTTVYTIRLDTQEEIRSRAMMGDELNMELSTGGKTFKELATRPLEDTATVCE
jgi:hypothetical protein